ncbi:MAG: helix-turn-helix domain-containing protein [Clostridia bacterium]|nr:helix-turn-helix domain-containing protein [Clostridia bacterium]
MIETRFIALSKLDINAAVYAAGHGIWQRGKADQYTASGRRTNLFYFMISGKRQYYIGGKPAFTLNPGDIIFIPITSCYRSMAVDEPHSEGIYIDFGLFRNGEELYVNDPFRVFHHMNEYLPHFRNMVDNRYDRLRLKGELYQLLSVLAAHEAAALHGNDTANSIYRAVLEMEKHPERSIDIAAMARTCCLSETGFREQFKRFTGGVTPMEYRNRLRIDRADDLIASGSFSIGQIADKLGFYDTAHFYRVYKKIRGATPRENHSS